MPLQDKHLQEREQIKQQTSTAPQDEETPPAQQQVQQQAQQQAAPQQVPVQHLQEEYETNPKEPAPAESQRQTNQSGNNQILPEPNITSLSPACCWCLRLWLGVGYAGVEFRVRGFRCASAWGLGFDV